ncbi:hypothetical protein GVN24_02700 [Rhizobium sp. CRIBSB]|nr:hypothetical protein [Rhizobium sp. CRIBSB]
MSRQAAYVFGFENQPPPASTLPCEVERKPLVRLILPQFGGRKTANRSMGGHQHFAERNDEEVAVPEETSTVPTAAMCRAGAAIREPAKKNEKMRVIKQR